jgi:glycosyltransferase involved in cell wall biosynthesis
VFRLECDPFPLHGEGGRPLLFLGHPALHRLAGRLLGLDEQRADRALARRLGPRARQRALARELRRRSVGVVLAEYGPTAVAILPACRIAGLPLVAHFHGYDASMHDTLRTYELGYRQLFVDAAAVVAVSRQMRHALIALGCPEEKVVYNPYGIDLEAFAPGRPERRPPRFLAVGRFVEKKAPQLVLRAFALVAADCPEARLVMIGDGPLLERCGELASELGVSSSVDFTGALPPAHVARHMAGARCFVQHSVTPPSGDMEGTPLAVLEAMASALPVVASRHGGIPDVVVDGVTGFLVAERDIRGTAVAMRRLAEDPGLAARLGGAGRSRAEESHSVGMRVRLLDEVLQRAARATV